VTMSKFIYPSRLSILLKEFTSLCNVSQGCGPHPSALTPFVWLVAASDAEINLVLFMRNLLSFSPDLVSNRSANSTSLLCVRGTSSFRMSLELDRNGRRPCPHGVLRYVAAPDSA